MDKGTWRVRLLAARAAVTPRQHADEAHALAAAVARLDLPEVVCGYVPTPAEPGSTAMLDALLTAGARVLLPHSGPPGPLRWGWYSGVADLVPGRFGILEPGGASLTPDVVGTAGLILVPALAVDRRGVRLGRGAGYYDRTLGLAAGDVRLMAVVRDSEWVDELPEEPHDRRMGWVLTPGNERPIRCVSTLDGRVLDET